MGLSNLKDMSCVDSSTTYPPLVALKKGHPPPQSQGLSEPAVREVGSRRRGAKERLTVTLPVELLDRLRNAVFWTPNLTLARLIEDAVTQYVDALEEKNGEPFPQRMHELKGGRPRRIRTDSLHA